MLYCHHVSIYKTIKALDSFTLAMAIHVTHMRSFSETDQVIMLNYDRVTLP